MMSLLAATRAALGPAPRSLSRRVPPVSSWPEWATRHDELSRVKDAYGPLLDRGEAQWGYAFIANVLLFEPGNSVSVAGVVHAPPGARGAHLEELERASEVLPTMKADAADPDIASLAASIAKETERFFSRPVPPVASGGVPLLCSTVMIDPSHLPYPYLAARFFPVMVSSERPEVIVLPWRAWAPDVVQAWTAVAIA
jgi:hypothetical protein